MRVKVKAMQDRLQGYYTRAFPEQQGAQVNDLVRISDGWESDVYAFTVEYGPVGKRRQEDRILRIYPGDDAYDKSGREFQGMRCLYQVGYPVPQVIALEREQSPFGRPFMIMEKIEGQLLWPLWAEATQEKQEALLTLFCQLFLQLHRLDWRPFLADGTSFDSGDPYIFVDQWLEMLRSYWRRFPVPGFTAVTTWLEARRDRVPCLRPAPIHWDYHPGNVLLRDDGSAVVIDWTQVQISDSRFDLAWTLLLTGAHEDSTWRDRILQEYERLAGNRVDQLAFFEVAACLKRLGSFVLSLSYGAEKLGMRPEAVAMMKQNAGAFERVYALLLARTGLVVPEVETLLASLA